MITDKAIRACPPAKVSRFPPGFIPTRYIEDLEHDQKLKTCCRHPENHYIEAFYSSEAWQNKTDPLGRHDPLGGVPDIYVFWCNVCKKGHGRFMIGNGDVRPIWD